MMKIKPNAAARASASQAHLADMLVHVGRGDRAAFQALHVATSSKLFGLALQIVRDRTDAEDVLQDTYLNVWKKAGSFDSSRASPIRWLTAVTRNCAIDQLREKKKRNITLIDEAVYFVDSDPLADALLIEAADWRLLHECIASLDQRDSHFIKGAFITGLTYADLAKRERKPLGSVKSVIRRALMKLKSSMETKLYQPR